MAIKCNNQDSIKLSISKTIRYRQEYSRGPYNKSNDKEQWIRLSEGCPNDCEYCRETKYCGKKPIYFEIPEIVRNKVVIIDMNLLYKPKALEIIKELGKKRVNGKVIYYELNRGVDWRYITQEMADALKESRFKRIRFAWDLGLEYQYKIHDCYRCFIRAGYRKKDLSCFIICNWKITHKECLVKLDLLKIWGIKVVNSYFDQQKFKGIKPIYWTFKELQDYNRKCKQHNEMVLFGINPRIKPWDSSQKSIFEAIEAA